MKKIIIGLMVAVAVVIPFHVSLVSAAPFGFSGNSGLSNGDLFVTGGSADAVPFGYSNNASLSGGASFGTQAPASTPIPDSFFFDSDTSDNLPFGYSNTSLQGGDFFGSGSSYNNPNPIGTCDYFGCGESYNDPFEPCSPYACGLLCDGESWCDQSSPVTPAPLTDCEWYACDSDTSTNDNANGNENNNENSNNNTIIIENYIQMPAAATRETVANRTAAHAPVIVSTPETSATENRSYTYQVVAIDTDGNTLTYSLVASPDGMTIDGYTGLIRWTPSRSQSGQAHTATVFVSDGVHQTAQSFQISVAKAARVVATETADQGRVAGTSIVGVAEASDKNTLRAYNVRVDTDELGNSVVSWDTTKPSRGRVMFGRATQGDRTGTDFTGAGQYEFSTPNTPETSTSHRVILGQLDAERVYYFRVVSIAGTDTSVSTERSFVQLGNGDTLGSDAGFASVIGTLGSFFFSTWFLLLMVIIIVLIIVFRRRNQHEIVAHAPVEMHVGGGHH